jgi:PST family polysaccharide transporter
LAAPINRAVFSGYSKFSSNLANLRETYMSVAGIIWLIALPVAAGIACTAPQIVILFLGSKWTEAIPILQILAIGGLASVMTANTQFVFMTIGKPAINTLNSLVTALLLVPSAIILSMKMGVVGAAYAFTGTVCTVLPIIFCAFENSLSACGVRCWLL